MSDLDSAQGILDHAIAMEQAAADLYTSIAGRMKHDAVRDVFLSFAAEERGHKAKLEQVKAGGVGLGSATAVLDLKIADYTVDVELSDDPTYADILLFAMKQEKQAFRLYSDLAARTEDAELQTLFLSLAQEEAKHKLRFEIEYDDNVLTEN